MSFVIYHPELGGFIKKHDGMNLGRKDPRDATRFATREEATNQRPGHHRDMGGSGYSGAVMSLHEAEQYAASRESWFGSRYG